MGRAVPCVPRKNISVDKLLCMCTKAGMRGAGEENETRWGCGRIRGRGGGASACGNPHCLHHHTGTEDYQLNSECNSDVICPPKCRCESGVVECSNLKLTKIPDRIPQSTAEL